MRIQPGNANKSNRQQAAQRVSYLSKMDLQDIGGWRTSNEMHAVSFEKDAKIMPGRDMHGNQKDKRQILL